MKKTLYVLACALCTLLVLPAAAQVPSYVPTDGLVGWWPFNGNANDESGNGNDGVVNGATLTEDRFGSANSAFTFNVSSIQISNANSINSDISSEVTLNAWITLEGFPSGFAPIISKDGPSYHQYELFIEPTSLGFWSTEIYDNIGTLPFNFQNWYMVTVTFNSGVINYYINCELIGSNQVAVNNMIGSDTPLEFGADSPNGVQYHHGNIDDIAIYNRALTEQEIHNLYTGTTPPPCVLLPSNLQQGLVGYWPFCGNANDESGNGNDGVVNGATLTEDRFGNAGKAYEFNGINNWIEITDDSSLDIVNEVSIAAWVYKPIFNQRYEAIVVKDQNGTITDNINYKFQISFSDNMDFYTSRGTILSTFTTLDWHFFVGVCSMDSIFLYLDNILIASSPNQFNTNGLTNNNLPLTFGRLPYDEPVSAGNERMYFEGKLDDIGIWNRALTPEEVQELYTLDACTFTVYDTLTVYETVYDTVYTYETIYDTVTTYVTVTDTLLIDITFTGFEGQPSWLNTVTVFPNPASDHITIDYGNFALMAGYNTIITDAAGATVYSSAVNSQQVEIDINAWGATGVYYMSVYDASGELVAVRHIVLE